MSNFYTLEKQPHPWGDYCDILLNGMSSHLGGKGGCIQLERTGPFVPPISLPGINDIVVTDAFRRELEASGLAGLRFQPVIKKLIVRSDWHKWDRKAEEPFEYPESGEPEDYILGKPHSAEIAAEMGELWEVLLDETAKVSRAQRICTREDIHLLIDSWQGEDLFRAEGVGYIYATERAKDWFESHAGEYVAFQAAPTKDTL
jgi:hypothetical protein